MSGGGVNRGAAARDALRALMAAPAAKGSASAPADEEAPQAGGSGARSAGTRSGPPGAVVIRISPAAAALDGPALDEELSSLRAGGRRRKGAE